MKLFDWTWKQEIRLHLKSGRTLCFFARKLTTTTSNATGHLIKVNVEHHRGFPHYANVDEIAAITTHKVPFWKGLD